MLTASERAASIAVVVLATFAGARCGSRTIAPVAPDRPPRAATLEEVVGAYDGYCRRLDTLSAKGDLDVRDLRAGRARKVGVRVLAARGGRLYLKGSVAVVTALEVVANGERFWLRVPSKKTIWTGPAGADLDESVEGDQAPYYALRPQDVVSALLPEPLEPAAGEALVLDADHDQVALTLARMEDGRGVARTRVALERSSLNPTTMRLFDATGTLVREVRLSGFENGLPRRILLTRPREGYEAELTLEEVQANVRLPERAFGERPAEGYTVIEVGKQR
jgi:hypothetical protein